VGLTHRSRSRLTVLVRALQINYLEVTVTPIDWLVRCGTHLYTLLLAVPGPMGVGAAMVRAGWLALALFGRSSRSW
jgi:hypothetical protein